MRHNSRGRDTSCSSVRICSSCGGRHCHSGGAMSRCCVVKVITMTEIQLLQVGRGAGGRDQMQKEHMGAALWVLHYVCVCLCLHAREIVMMCVSKQNNQIATVECEFRDRVCSPSLICPHISQSGVCGFSYLLVSRLSKKHSKHVWEGFLFHFHLISIDSRWEKDTCRHCYLHSVTVSVCCKNPAFWRNESKSPPEFCPIFVQQLNVTITLRFISCWIFLKWKENLGKTETQLGKSFPCRRNTCEFVCYSGMVCAAFQWKRKEIHLLTLR